MRAAKHSALVASKEATLQAKAPLVGWPAGLSRSSPRAQQFLDGVWHLIHSR